jgi:chloramphenicol 3-O phosphotransferase
VSDGKGAIILLNGASSAGKSTLARALQEAMPVPFLRFSLDIFLFSGEVLPTRRDGAFARSALRRRLFDGYFGCLGALAAAGNGLIVDHIIESADHHARLVAALNGFDVFFVGVHCPLAELERRERARGDRRPGEAAQDLRVVHGFGPYDIEVDSTLPAEANAATIAAAWRARLPPGRFGQAGRPGPHGV